MHQHLVGWTLGMGWLRRWYWAWAWVWDGCRFICISIGVSLEGGRVGIFPSLFLLGLMCFSVFSFCLVCWVLGASGSAGRIDESHQATYGIPPGILQSFSLPRCRSGREGAQAGNTDGSKRWARLIQRYYFGRSGLLGYVGSDGFGVGPFQHLDAWVTRMGRWFFVLTLLRCQYHVV